MRLIFTFLLICSTLIAGENFTCENEYFAEVAEQARVQSAMFWHGEELPNWHAPCPITIEYKKTKSTRENKLSGGGATNFTFEGGQVFGWKMQVSGSLVQIEEAIRHEVDHAVRASLVRKPIPRWLDEGCSTLFEDSESQQPARNTVRGLGPEYISVTFLRTMDYPKDAKKLNLMYKVGFSFTEFLYHKYGGAKKLIAIQKSSLPLDAAIQKTYGKHFTILAREWSVWKENFKPKEHVVYRNQQCLPLLAVWKASWCAPCRNFQAEWDNNPEFRASIQSVYHVHFFDFNKFNQLAQVHGITGPPTFDCPAKRMRVSRYRTPDQLLSDLGCPPINQPVVETPVVETPVVETPVVETPVVETPVVETPVVEPVVETPVVETPVVETPVVETPVRKESTSFLRSNYLSGMAGSTLSWVGDHAKDPNVWFNVGMLVLSGGAVGGATWKRKAITGVAKRLLGRDSPTVNETIDPVSDKLDRLAETVSGLSQLDSKIVSGLSTTLVALLKDKVEEPSEKEESFPVLPIPRKMDDLRQILSHGELDGHVPELTAFKGLLMEDVISEMIAEEEEDGDVTRVLRMFKERLEREFNDVAPITTQTEE